MAAASALVGVRDGPVEYFLVVVRAGLMGAGDSVDSRAGVAGRVLAASGGKQYFE